MSYTIEEARLAADDLEREVADLRVRDRETGRFVAAADPIDALQRGGHEDIAEAAAALRRGQAAGLARIGIGSPAPPAAADKPKGPGDFGGGVRGQPITPAGPSMNDAIRALAHRDRGY